MRKFGSTGKKVARIRHVLSGTNSNVFLAGRSSWMIWALLFLLISSPVIAAFSISRHPDVGSFALSMLAIGLYQFALLQLVSRLQRRLIRISILFAAMFLLFSYQFAYFLAYYFTGEGFDESFLFHFNLNTLAQTWAVYGQLTFAFGLSILSLLLLCAFATRNLSRKTVPAYAAIAALLGAPALDPELRRMLWSESVDQRRASSSIMMQTINWEGLALNMDALEQSAGTVAAGRNLVLIYLEGLENLYTEDDHFPGLTPHLDKYSSQGLRFTDIHQVSGTEWTVAGMVASQCGTPLLHNRGLHGNSVLFSRFLDRAVCLGDVLHAAGYKQSFMGGASTEFAGKGAFLLQHGYDRIAGREGLLPRVDDHGYRTAWGLYDDTLFDLAVEEFNTLADQEQAFNLTLLTLDTHHPSGHASRSCSPYAGDDNSILDAVHCTDQLIERFLSRISAHPAYQDTVVVLISDHLSMRNNAFSLFPEDYERRLFFSVLNTPWQGVNDTVGTPMDLAPTVLDLLEVEHELAFLAGYSLLQDRPDINEAILNAPSRHRNLRYLNSEILSTMPGDLCSGSGPFVDGSIRNGVGIGENIIPLAIEGEPLDKDDLLSDYVLLANVNTDRTLDFSLLISSADWNGAGARFDDRTVLIVAAEWGVEEIAPALLSAEQMKDDDAVFVLAGNAGQQYQLLGIFPSLEEVAVGNLSCLRAFSSS